VAKAGAGNQTFAGTNTYAGGTTITGGTLTVTNSAAIGTGSIAVGTGATLGGTVTVPVPSGKTISGTGTVATPLTVNGTLAPGRAPGTGPGILTAGANVTFVPGSTFAVDLNGNTPGNTATNHGQLLLNGTAPTLDLGGATLAPTLGYTPSGGDTLFIAVITDPAGTVAGTFNGIPQGGTIVVGSYAAQVSYTGDSTTSAVTGGNDVVLYNFAAAPVPEPAGVLAVAAATGLLVRRPRRTRPTPEAAATAAA
jgi:autotransporter-associated beta strand protein